MMNLNDGIQWKKHKMQKEDKFSKNQLRKKGIILIHMKVLPSQEFTDKSG